MKEPHFSMRKNQGFWITFQNGYTISVQFGAPNYCYYVQSPDAKMAILKDGEFVTGDVLEKLGVNLEGDGLICSQCTPDDVGLIIGLITKLQD